MRSGVLLVVGSNPATTSGQRTLGRADKARQVLGFESFELANIFSVPTYRTGDISVIGIETDGWLTARRELCSALDRTSGVLLAYGTGKPSGVAGKHQTAQIEWLKGEISERDLDVWTVGGEARHPSRWQRYTYREFPGVDFLTALEASLTRA